jgi:Ser/Thr protein kinase RdoA (MazF antagonist)
MQQNLQNSILCSEEQPIAVGDFDILTPDVMVSAVEVALDCPMTGLAVSMPSYINRVYEIQTAAGERLIAKFYRPGRWSLETLQDEHQFMLDCAAEEIPLVPPMKLANGKTLAKSDGIYFAVFKKRSGREFDIREEDDWKRLGNIVARMHLAGAQRKAPNRLKLHPETATEKEVDYLVNGGFVSPNSLSEFKDICNEILELISGLFDNKEYIRVHGDCHRGNLLDRPDEGIMVIDFDDMMTAPPVQDLWLLLPGYAHECPHEIDLLLEGYEQFREFDYTSIQLIEPLRAMRIIYFLSWCSRQVGDFKFEHHYPDWGTPSFWRREICDLRTQLEVIKTGQQGNNQDNLEYSPRQLTDH